jgi:hypothetical protein
MAQVEPRCADPNEGNLQWSTSARRVHFVDPAHLSLFLSGFRDIGLYYLVLKVLFSFCVIIEIYVSFMVLNLQKSG